jgi:hypothetical protein
MKSKLEFYALAVCFTAVVCLIICFSVAGYGIVEITYPELTMRSFEYAKYQSNDSFWEHKQSGQDPKAAKPSEEELTKERLEALALTLKVEKQEGLQDFIKTVMVILASDVALLVHWKIAKKARIERA